jgi:protein-S-isoprenylcysteine O-methyltransferase Ste14
VELHLTAGWVALAISFLAFNVGSVAFFRATGRVSMRLKLFLALVPGFQLTTLAWLALVPPTAAWRQALLVAGANVSVAIFAAALVSARRQRFGPIFGGQGGSITISGAFAVVRHPFYSAYMTCYLCLAVASGVPAITAGALILIGLYIHAARAEEQSLAQGPRGAIYRRYCQHTGRFLPRLARSARAPVPMGMELSRTK